MKSTKKELLKSYLLAIRDGAVVGAVAGVVILPIAIATQVALNALSRGE